MIIQDEGTLEEAIALVEQGPVRYSDKHAFMVVDTSNRLRGLATSALSRGEIAIVAPRGAESSMEDYDRAFSRIQAQRKRDEQKKVRAWVAEHPEVKEATSEQEVLRLYRKARKEELSL